MFLPQRPYLSIGTLRDQIIYPSTELEMRESGRRDTPDLESILSLAHLSYLPAREGGFDTRKEWSSVLSGGERQRMAIARLLYHEPAYAFVDEGTSAVSSDVEGLLYQTCKDRGITLITISTRASLKKYHEYNLILGIGEAGDEWEINKIGTVEEKVGVEKELVELRGKLDMVDGWKKRRADIDAELNNVFIKEHGEGGRSGGGKVLEEPEYLKGDEGRGAGDDGQDTATS